MQRDSTHHCHGRVKKARGKGALMERVTPMKRPRPFKRRLPFEAADRTFDSINSDEVLQGSSIKLNSANTTMASLSGEETKENEVPITGK